MLARPAIWAFGLLLILLPITPAWAGGPDPHPAEREAAESEEAPKIRLEPYGYLKLDLSEDSSLVEPGNFARWVVSESVVAPHAHFNMTARETRLGMRVRALDDEDLSLLGRAEIDFYGGGAENKNSLMLRHAYLQVDWADSGWSLLAGQTADLISPLVPSTLNYSVAWWVGNIGYRRPQVRVTKRNRIGDASTVILAGAVSRTIGDDFGAVEPGDSGADSGLPTLQGRLAYGWTGEGGRSATVGVSGHWGRENLHEAPVDPDLQFDSWSVNLDVSVSITPAITVKGELWSGRNLDDYLGAVGQGVNFVDAVAIDANGGWLTVDVVPAPGWRASVGAAVDDPVDSTLAPTGRSRNRAVWATVVRDLGEHLSAGVEVSHWRTTYLSLEPSTSARVQGSVIFAF